MKGIPVLMYHALEDEVHPAGAKDPGEQLYVLQVNQFRAQMEYLYREGFKTFLLEELHTMSEWPEKSVVLTFDDGHESNYTLALPILQEFGLKAHFFITTGWIGTPHFMTEEQIRGLHQAGMGIGSHGVTHAFLDDIDAKEMERELFESKNGLSNIIGAAADSLAAPGGRIHKSMNNRTDFRDFLYVCTSMPGLFSQNSSPYAVPRFPVCANTPFSVFTDIIARNDKLISKMQRRTNLLSFSKFFLGNKLYERVRKFIFIVSGNS